MQYMLLIYGEEVPGSAERPRARGALEEYAQLSRDLRAEEQAARAARSSSRSRRRRPCRCAAATPSSPTGPFAETKEALGGFYLIEADSLDDAIEWAGRIPAARHGTIEVRPVVDHSGNGA